MSKLNVSKLVGGVVAVGLLTTAAPAAVVIDDFNVGPTTLSGTSGQSGVASVQGPLAADHLAGGYRQITFDVPPTPTGTVQMKVDTTKHRFTYTVSTSTGSGSLSAINYKMTYNGSATGTSNMDLDLAADGSNALAIDFEVASFAGGSGHFDIAVGSTTNGTTGGLYVDAPVQNSASPFTLIVPLTGPNVPYGNTLDLSHVSSISIGTANGNLPGPGEFFIDAIRTTSVPEPTATAGILAAAGIPLCARSRRRK